MTRFSVLGNISKWMCLTIAALMFIPVGCTVKEDREPCPCYLDVDYANVLAAGYYGSKVSGRVEVSLFAPQRENYSAFGLQECPSVHENVVNRGKPIVVGVVHNRPLREFLGRGSVLTWESGNEIDSVYVHSSLVDCTGEVAYCLLEPHKQFHTLFFHDQLGGQLLREYNMVVVGSTCGFDSASETFEAVEGEYLYTVQEYDSDGGVSVRVPRQVSDDLRLEFWTKDDYRRVFVSPIGQYMAATGYDRDALDLQDFDITISFREATVFVRVAGWKDEWMFPLFE